MQPMENRPDDEDDIVLPDPKEVNRQISLELKRAKEAKRKKQRGFGTGIQALQGAMKKHPNDPIRQIMRFFDDVQLRAWTGREREVGAKTRSDFKDCLVRAVRELKQEGMPIRNMSEMNRVHAIKLVERWGRAGQAAATIQTKVSFLRKFLVMTGKGQAMPRGSEWDRLLRQKGLDTKSLTRSKVATASKAWEAKGIDPYLIIQRIREIDAVVAMQVEMQLAFGLRVLESMEMEPSVSDVGTKLFVFRGAKGGRGRTVDFSSDPAEAEWQRDVLERAKLIAQQHPKRRLAIKGLRLDQSRNRYNFVMRKVGITQKELGVTSHGLRHQFAARRFAEMSGMRPMVENTTPAWAYRENREVVEAAQYGVSQDLGHWRKDVTAPYIGSVPKLSHLCRQRMETTLESFEGNERVMDAIRDARVSQLWVIGKAASGLPLMPGEALTLSVRLVDESDISKRLNNLKTRLDLHLGRPVEIMLQITSGLPKEVLEIFIPAEGYRQARSA